MGNSPSNLLELLRTRTQEHPDRIAFTYLHNGEVEQGHLTYADLARQAQAIAHALKALTQHLPKGLSDPLARAMLIYPYEAGLEFIVAFIACLYTPVIAVPCHPPRNQQGLLDLHARLSDAEAAIILTTRSLLPKLKRQLQAEFNPDGQIHWLATDDVVVSNGTLAPDWQLPNISPTTPTFLQYTSGSTGKPKGVIITHHCLWHNQRMLQVAFQHSQSAIAVSWLPLFHDMGLIGSILQSLYAGSRSILMSPIAFVQKPVRWLNAISRYQASTSGAPNFAYDLLCRHVTDAQRDRLDLRSWDLAFCGAEPVRETTLNQFADRFHACGFRKTAFYPCYGMAEATLFITGGQKAELPKTLSIDGAELAQNQVVLATPSSARRQTLVSCGHAGLDTQVVIVDPVSRQPCGEQQIGEIWVSGAGVSPGYWHQVELTEQRFRATLSNGGGNFLRTGDLGFLYENELFVTGRLHDVLVFWGFNHYPEQIEQTVEACHSAFRANGCAAFSVSINGNDQLIIAQEVERHHRDRLTITEIVETVRWAIFQNHFLDVGAILLIKPNGLPRTSSGKIQRSQCRQQFVEGGLPVLADWRTPKSHDISGLVRRYLNPLTHLKRYKDRYQGQFRRYFRLPLK